MKCRYYWKVDRPFQSSVQLYITYEEKKEDKELQLMP